MRRLQLLSCSTSYNPSLPTSCSHTLTSDDLEDTFPSLCRNLRGVGENESSKLSDVRVISPRRLLVVTVVAVVVARGQQAQGKQVEVTVVAVMPQRVVAVMVKRNTKRRKQKTNSEVFSQANVRF